VDPTVSSVVHYVASLYYKAERDFAEFYKASLQYLAFVSSDDLDHDFKLVRHYHSTYHLLVEASLSFVHGQSDWESLLRLALM